MTGERSGRRDLVGWLAAAGVAAALFGGAAAAALRSAPGAAGAGAVEAVALDLSVGVVPVSAALSSVPPVVEIAAPLLPDAPQGEAAPELPVAVPEPVAMPRPDLRPVMDLPQADAPPVMAAAPPPVPDAPALDLAQSPRPVVRPDPAKGEAQQAEAAQAAAPQPEAQAERAQSAVAPAQAAGSDQAARPAPERRAAGGQAAARYGDQVLRQIARLRRHKAPERGVVTVGFEIGADGGLRRVAVVASSGSGALDQVALDHIRRAAPFPPPPEGASMRFAFEFVGR